MANNTYYAEILNASQRSSYEIYEDIKKYIDEDYSGAILIYIATFDEGWDCEIRDVVTDPCRYVGDELMAEDSEYAVVYNSLPYENVTMFRKLDVSQFRKCNQESNGELMRMLAEKKCNFNF